MQYLALSVPWQVMGASEETVSSYEQMLSCLDRGSVGRSVGSTSMNAVSSRSHAIFTVTIEQHYEAQTLRGDTENANSNSTSDANLGGVAGTLEFIATGADEVQAAPPSGSGPGGSIVSKFHFVDLAGSERAKKTQAAGER